MPGRGNYPTGGDLLAFLEAAGLTVTAGQSDLLEDMAAAGRREFETRTGIRPFLARGAAVERRFDPPRRSQGLELLPPLVSLTSVMYQPTGASATLLTQGTDYTLLPLNASLDEQPYTQLDFSPWRTWWGLSPLDRGAIKVTGVWGWGTTIPEDAWLAMCGLGITSAAGTLAQAFTGGLVEWADEDTREKYGANPLEVLQSGWDSQAARALRNYRRMRV